MLEQRYNTRNCNKQRSLNNKIGMHAKELIKKAKKRRLELMKTNQN